MENYQQDHLSEMDLQLDGEVRQHFTEAGKWAKFISIVVFIGCALVLVFGIIGGASIVNAFRSVGNIDGILRNFGGQLIIAVIVFVVAVVSFVYYFLFTFSQKMKNALLTESTAQFNAALKSLKIFFIITTVLALLSLVNSIANMFN